MGRVRGSPSAVLILVAAATLGGCAAAGKHANTATVTLGGPVSTVGSGRPSAAEYVPNGGFESADVLWRAYQSGGLTRTSRVRHSGRWAVRSALATPLPAPYGVYLPGVIAAPLKGQRLTLSGWLLPSWLTVGHFVTLEINESGGPAAPRVVAKKTFRLRPGWHRYSIVGRVQSAKRTDIDIFFIALRSVGAGDSFYIDDVALLSPTPQSSR